MRKLLIIITQYVPLYKHTMLLLKYARLPCLQTLLISALPVRRGKFVAYARTLHESLTYVLILLTHNEFKAFYCEFILVDVTNCSLLTECYSSAELSMNWTLAVMCLCLINMCVNKKNMLWIRFDIDWSNYFELVSHGSACYIDSFTLGTHAHFMFSWTSRFRFRLFGRRHAKVLFSMLWRIRNDGVARAWRMKMSNFSSALPINLERWDDIVVWRTHIRKGSQRVSNLQWYIRTYRFAKCPTHSKLSTLPS